LRAEKVLRELSLIGFANMQDYITIDGDGCARIDLWQLSRDQAAAIQEITVEDTEGDGKSSFLRPSVASQKYITKRFLRSHCHFCIKTNRREQDLVHGFAGIAGMPVCGSWMVLRTRGLILESGSIIASNPTRGVL
jgi:hypothetical protein